MFDATCIKGFISSPSDVQEERNIVRKVMQKWNSKNAEKEGKTLMPMGQEDATVEMGEHPQDHINKQLLTKSDLLIGIIHSRVGTPTKNFDGGTIEEIKTNITNKKPTLLFFSEKQVDKNVDFEQLKKVREFFEWCKENGYLNTYSDLFDFEIKVQDQLDRLMNSTGFFISFINHKNKENEKYIEIRIDQSPYLHIYNEIHKNDGYEAESAVTQTNVMNVGNSSVILMKVELFALLDGKPTAMQTIGRITPAIIKANEVKRFTFEWKADFDVQWFSFRSTEFGEKYDNRFTRFPSDTTYSIKFTFSNGYIYDYSFEKDFVMKLDADRIERRRESN